MIDLRKCKPKFANLIGRPFGRLTVVGYVGWVKHGHKWLCRCNCTTDEFNPVLKEILGNNLLAGKTLSCGCLQRERASQARTIHGEAHRSVEYTAWCQMKARCGNDALPGFEHWGGRGITICERWLIGEGGIAAFTCFLADMGRRPSNKHSIDRINVNGNYEPGNCRWTTVAVQAVNKTTSVYVNHNGIATSLAIAIAVTGYNRSTYYNIKRTTGLSSQETFDRMIAMAAVRMPARDKRIL